MSQEFSFGANLWPFKLLAIEGFFFLLHVKILASVS